MLNLRKENKIKWFGIWKNDHGYWDGIAKENKLGKLNETLGMMPSGFYLLKDNYESIYSFYDAYMQSVKKRWF